MAKSKNINTKTRKEIAIEMKGIREALKNDDRESVMQYSWNIYLLIRDGAGEGVNS